MSKVYVVGDTHFGHRNICKYRPMFSTPEEHDKAILTNILETCKKRDSLWILGDICFTKDSLAYLREISQHVSVLRIILGNHCYNKIADYVDIVPTVDSLVSKYNVWLSHPPIHPDEIRGRIGNIHGHCHGYAVDDPRYRCVSLEQTNFRPIDIHEIIEEMKEKTGYVKRSTESTEPAM